jgi:hypothetical protein
MALGKHQHRHDGRYRRERGDSLAGNLGREYSELQKVDPRTKLETLRQRFDVDSLNKVRQRLRRRAGDEETN